MTGAELKRLREGANLTQLQLAAVLGVHLATLSRWEQRQDKPISRTGVLLVEKWQNNRSSLPPENKS